MLAEKKQQKLCATYELFSYKRDRKVYFYPRFFFRNYNIVFEKVQVL